MPSSSSLEAMIMHRLAGKSLMLSTHAATIITFKFDPSLHKLARILQFFERTGKYVLIGIDKDHVEVSQHRQGLTAALQPIVTWAKFDSDLLGLTHFSSASTASGGRVVVECAVAALSGALAAILNMTLAQMEVSPSGRMRLIAKQAMSMREYEDDLRMISGSHLAGLVIHEIPCNAVDASVAASLKEPEVDRPSIAIRLPHAAIVNLKTVLIRMGGNAHSIIRIEASAQGTLRVSHQTSLMDTALMMRGLSLVNPVISEGDHLMIEVNLNQLIKSISSIATTHQPGHQMETILAIIPRKSLVLSTAIQDDSGQGLVSYYLAAINTD